MRKHIIEKLKITAKDVIKNKIDLKICGNVQKKTINNDLRPEERIVKFAKKCFEIKENNSD